MFFGPITDAFAGFRVGDQIKTGTRFLGGHRFEPVVFGGPQLSTCHPTEIRNNLI